ncbi:MAG: MBL fold metallo-hydrolase [Brachymonas sp.]|nr:MBL fold metallo-hydrolase [Brachymonas sp.]
MLHHETLPVTAFEQNCSLIWCDQTMEGAVIDPGGDLPQILALVARHGVKVKQILLTHGHVDHCAGAADLARQLGVPIVGPHVADQFWIEALPEVAARYGFPPAETFTPARWLQEGDAVQVGQECLQVRHCPGHAPGHVVFHAPQQRLAFVGDVLFAGSIGRTDFPQGDHDQLIRSIIDKLWPMGDDTVFVPGHGPRSSFGRERQTNPFVRGT